MQAIDRSSCRRCRYSWLIPLIGFAVTSFFGVGASLGNVDDRMLVQYLGLAAFAALIVIGGYFTVQALRQFQRHRIKRCLYHGLAGLAVNLSLAVLTAVSASAVYRIQQPPAHLPTHTLADFRPTSATTVPLPVWIDTDPACGEGATDDIDDCWALAAALRAPELAVRGISTVFGNTDNEQAFRIARELIQQFGNAHTAAHQPPVLAGANVAGEGVWPATPASQALAEALQREKLTIIAQGPLTNIATVLVRRTELAERIERIVMIGGRSPGELFHPGQQWWFHFRDFNIRKDTPAAKIVLDSGVPLVLMPFELAVQVKITRADLDRLATGDDAARWLRQVSEQWLDFWEDFLHKRGFSPFDALAVGYLINPEWFQCQVLPARIGFDFFLEPFGMGRDLEVAPYIKGPPVYYCSAIDARFKDALIARLVGALPSQAINTQPPHAAQRYPLDQDRPVRRHRSHGQGAPALENR